MTDDKELRAASDRIETLMGELAAAGPPVQAKAEELVRQLMRLYGAGLERILTLLEEVGPAAGPLFARLAADDLIATLMVLHDLHPLELGARVVRALDQVRPYLGSHGGDVKLLGVEDGVVRLRLEGSCHGCPSSAVTMKLAIERAIEEAAPEVTRIEVEGVADPAAAGASTAPGAPGTPAAPGIPGIPGAVGTPGTPLNTGGPASAGAHHATVQIGGGRSGGRWMAVAAPDLGPGGLAVVELSGLRVVVCKPGEAWYAYRDSCPACGAPLATGALHDELLSCAACTRRYDVRRAGSLAGAQGPPLEPLPLLAEGDVLQIAIPAALFPTPFAAAAVS